MQTNSAQIDSYLILKVLLDFFKQSKSILFVFVFITIQQMQNHYDDMSNLDMILNYRHVDFNKIKSILRAI